MVFAPFRDFLALIVFNRNFDLPQYLFAGLADSRTQGGNGLRGIEIKDIQKIFMLEVISRLHAAAGQQCVGGADHGGVPKSHSDVEIIILFQKGIVNDAEDVAPVVVPVFIHKLRRDTLQLIGKTVFTGNIKTAFQRRRHHIPMLRLIFPKVRAARVLAACVGYIEYISQLGIISGSVNEGNTLAAAPYIPAHLFVPEVIFRTGRSFRALGENHKLFIVGVLIQPCSGGQKRRPLLVASRDLPRRVVCHLCVEL
ncbi:hypothetical protein [Clostridium porci]|uniref:Uncharacterized protein n=1 Tax=Clostridium porci TaxID=2605778 RepID=A0A7X2TC07_9CLOT|nr:hypothetical protein [Clostridium porci]MSS36025.1 hypothetical protein [Clostridium porci]